MKFPQTPRKEEGTFLQRIAKREKEYKATIAELLAKNLKLQAENERLRANALLPQSIGRTNGACTTEPEQRQ